MPVALQDLLEQVNALNNTLIQQVDSSNFQNEDDGLEFRIPNRKQPPPIPSLSLRIPSASTFIARLEVSGTPYSHARELAAILVERSAELAERYTAIYTKTCEELGSLWRPSSLQSLSSLYGRIGRLQETYNLKVDAWEDDMLSIARERYYPTRSSLPPQPASSKNSFNNDYVPTLNAFFEENMYPSRADRIHLAKRSGMTLRQINVWFQNKRRRTRETGVNPAKDHDFRSIVRSKTSRQNTPTSEYGANSVTTCYDTALSDGEETDVDDIEDDDLGRCSRSSSFTLVDEQFDPFDREVPANAFPAIYMPPDCEPFTHKPIDSVFPKFRWERTPSHTPLHHEVVDMDSLAEDLKNLQISDENTSDESSSNIAGKLATCMITPTQPAPLPALLPSTHVWTNNNHKLRPQRCSSPILSIPNGHASFSPNPKALKYRPPKLSSRKPFPHHRAPTYYGRNSSPICTLPQSPSSTNFKSPRNHFPWSRHQTSLDVRTKDRFSSVTASYPFLRLPSEGLAY